MTIKQPSKLETIDNNLSGWDKILSKNASLLNDNLLKLQGLVDVNPRHLMDGTILVQDKNQGMWVPRKYHPYLDAGIPCNQDDPFDGTNGDPPRPLLWYSDSGSPQIQGNRLRMQELPASAPDRIYSTYHFVGDFDLMVHFDCTGAPTTNSWHLYFLVTKWDDLLYRFGLNVSYYDGQKRYYRFFHHGQFDTEFDYITRTKDVGLLRIQRHGNIFSAFYKNGTRDPRWRHLVGSVDGSVYGITGAMKMEIFTQSLVGDPGTTVYLDKFRIAVGANNITTTTTTTSTTTTTTTT